MLDTITKLLKRVLKELEEIIDILIKLVQQKLPDGENFKFLEKYYSKVKEINNAFQSESFNKEYVAKNIKEIFQKVNDLFKDFGNKVVFIIEDLKPKVIIERMGKLITSFVQLLFYINTFIKNTSNGMIKDTEKNVKEITNNSNQNNSAQKDSKDNNKIKQEILIYDEDGKLLNEGILDTVHGLLSSFGNSMANFGRLLYFRKSSVDKTLTSTGNAIGDLAKELNKARLDIGLNDRYAIYKRIFASHEFAVAVGGTLTVLGLFFILRRIYYKIKNKISKKYENIKAWGRGEDIKKKRYRYSYEDDDYNEW